MKKNYLLLLMLLLITSLNAKGFDFSVGGSYQFGYQYAYGQLDGFHQVVSIPVLFSYYPGKNNYVSLGLRNKIGYGNVLYQNKIYESGDTYEMTLNYNTIPVDHEIYENLSFIIKLGGEHVKFMAGLGCSLRYSFINIPDGTFELLASYDPDFDIYFLEAGDYQYLSAGPSFDFNIEFINKPKNFSFIVGLPFEFLIPVDKITQFHIFTDAPDIIMAYKDREYINFSFGLEFTASFYSFKEL